MEEGEGRVNGARAWIKFASSAVERAARREERGIYVDGTKFSSILDE